MNSVNFIKEKLNYLVDLYPTIKFRYKFSKLSQMHIVEVTPKELFRNNDEYAKLEFDISSQFDTIYFPECLHFISTDSITKIDNAEFEVAGSLHDFTNVEDFGFDFKIGLQQTKSVEDFEDISEVKSGEIELDELIPANQQIGYSYFADDNFSTINEITSKISPENNLTNKPLDSNNYKRRLAA